MQRSEGRACQTERQWDAQIKTAQNRRGRDSKTSVICNSLMFNGCSWIKNFKLLSARWKRRREEGGRDRRGGGGGGGGTSEQHIYICISTLHLVIRGKKTTASKNTLGAPHILPIFQQHKHQKTIPLICLSWCMFTFARTAWIWIVGSYSESGYNHGYGSGCWTLGLLVCFPAGCWRALKYHTEISLTLFSCQISASVKIRSASWTYLTCVCKKFF